MPTLRGSPLRFHMSGPKFGDGDGEALKPDTIGGALVGVLMIFELVSAGSSSISASFICDTPYIFPFAVSRGLRRSAAAASARPSIGEPQSHNEITRLRSIPLGRGGA